MANPLWKKGTSGNPAGRPKGVNNKLTQLVQTADQIAAKYKIMPLDYLMTIVNDESCGRVIRVDAAKAAAPYVHQKKPMAIEGGDPLKPITMVDILSLQEMETDKVEQLLTLLKQAGAELPLADGDDTDDD